MAELIPWAEFEEKYAENFSETMGAIAKPFRMALGALIKYLSKINCALLGRGSFGSRGGRGRGEKDLL